MASILVTGCNGTIGRHLTKVLLESGNRVVGVSLEPKCFCEHEALTYHSADLTNADAAEKAFRLEAVDAVVHLAALVHVRDHRLGFGDYSRVNYYASQRLFEQAVAHGVRRLVFASTIEVYGPTPANVRIDENAPCRPESDYARTKLLAEEALQRLASRETVDYAILRLAPIYAAGFRLNIDKRLYVKAPIGYYVHPGDYRLALCSVHNVQHFIVRWLGENQRASGIFNLADERSYGVRELLAREVKKGRCQITLPLPYWPGLLAIAAWQTALSLAGRQSTMFTTENFRKLLRSSEWDTRRAQAVVGRLPWNIDNTPDV